MIVKRLAFLLVGTLVLWYLAHFGFNALWLAFAGGETFLYSRLLDLALLPVCAVVAWAVLRRLERGGAA